MEDSRAPNSVVAHAGTDRRPSDIFKARSYQLEMFEESMKRNVIVAMDTGSGKTLIAILRIQAELERCSPEKLVWFLCPTVELVNQQHELISKQLPAFQTRVLSGADNVNHWTTQTIWDQILQNIRIVVSTHQILLDSLSHGFVRMSRLALIVFDEAHSCVGKHPSNRILRDFYHQCSSEERPAILGLTASPIVNSAVGSLDTLESNLTAIARTPRIHREELLQYVHPPQLVKLSFPVFNDQLQPSVTLDSLRAVYESLDIEEDPWIIKMKSAPDCCNSRALTKALISGKTDCHDHITSLYSKALAVQKELGSSGTDYYIRQCIEKARQKSDNFNMLVDGLESEEKVYLQKKLSDVVLPQQDGNCPSVYSSISPKVQTLIDYLRREDSADFSGLIFIKTRAEVAVLSHLLSIHTPSFEISTFVGASNFSGRKGSIGELADVKNQKTTLDDLRHGRKNLIVTTNALEEGIDVSRCRLVICFDRPPNLKSFVQRRGRARKSNSKYVIMFADDSDSELAAGWTALEIQMREIYMDHKRQLQEIHEEEEIDEETPLGQESLHVESTGAKVTLDDAVQHLYHFCNTLPAAPCVDRSPIFFFESHSLDSKVKSFSSRVLLPNAVDVSLRQASSTSLWRSEKMAKREAAFEAYKALFKAGLIDDHLLPLGHINEALDEAYSAVEKRPSLLEVTGQFNPWFDIAREWQCSTDIYACRTKVSCNGDAMSAQLTILLPCKMPQIGATDLYWNADKPFNVVFQEHGLRIDSTVISLAKQITTLLLYSVFPGRLCDQDDFTALLVPCDVPNLGAWLQRCSGAIKSGDIGERGTGPAIGLVRDLRNNRAPHIFHGIRYAFTHDMTNYDPMDIDRENVSERGSRVDLVGDDAKGKRRNFKELLDENETNIADVPVNHNKKARLVYEVLAADRATGLNQGQENSGYRIELLEVTRLPKNIDFLHYLPGQDVKSALESKRKLLTSGDCEIDRLPFQYAQLVMFFPSILHRVEVALVVDHLCENLLSPLQLQNRDLVTTAISASSAREGTNYQRLEFFGDSMLKYMTSLALIAGNLLWHEGILSHMKDHIVSNSSLASAALKAGLDRYILTTPFTGRKWRPLYNSTLIENQSQKKRQMSSKTLADVVEALIGAAYLDGGPENACACLALFLPDINWISPSNACEILQSVHNFQIPSSTNLVQVEELISYQFNSKSLMLEALTHGSHFSHINTSSYQRLEFLGDAVLDNTVTQTAFSHEPKIPTDKLHLIRTALVNGNYLGFLCLNLSISQSRINPVTDDQKHTSTVEAIRHLYLWQTMRHTSPTVSLAQQECVRRNEILKTSITDSINHSDQYPWTALAQLEPPKSMSDIVESLVGAIYIDSQGSLAACGAFLERLGLMAYLRRVMERDIALLHPKEELGQLANRDKVRYELGKEGEGREQRVTCGVFVGEREVVRVGGGLSVMEVQTRAADQACGIMKISGQSMRSGDESTEGAEDDMGENEDGVRSASDDEQEKDGDGEDDKESGSDSYLTADE